MKYLPKLSLTNVPAEVEGKYPSKSGTVGVWGIFCFYAKNLKLYNLN
jgi:hypothetical protein